MCGIAGIISSEPAQLRRVREMTRLLRHRGPDDEGFLLAERSGLSSLGGEETPQSVYDAGLASKWRDPAEDAFMAMGHRRLSILDLTARGHQPMRKKDRFWIVYNGEVFNYIELRDELAALGETFQSGTDTEVILTAFAVWGKGCFARFNGMWAIAVYDAAADELTLCRDRFGVKPLYYLRSGGALAFASEIKAFTGLQSWQPRCNIEVAVRFLAVGAQDTGSETMFEDVHQLKPGHLLELRPADIAGTGTVNLIQECWYKLQGTKFSGSFEEAARDFRDLFTDTVRLRLRSDVPLGFCLSGGLDSSAIIAAAGSLLKNDSSQNVLQSFTSCSLIARYDERCYAEIAARAAQAMPTFIYPNEQDLFDLLPELIWAQDEPFASTSIFAQWCVFAAAARSGVKVMLDGQGADESLCGYHNFLRPFFCGLLLSQNWKRAWQETRAIRSSGTKTATALLRAAVDILLPTSFQAKQTHKRRLRKAPQWLDKKITRQALAAADHEIVARGQSAGQLSTKLLSGAHVQALLHWEDRNSMAHSIESRVPFLDYRLVEFIVGLPDVFKIRNGYKKAVLRSGLRNLVPDNILDRKDKLGFVTPEAEWAMSSSKLFRKHLCSALEAASPLLSSSALREFDEIQSGRRAYSPALWRALCFGHWLRRFEIRL